EPRLGLCPYYVGRINPHPCMRPMYNFLGKFKPDPREETE
ncbi:TPA: hypothetical protein ACOV1J_004335, partial [Escherichia coli]